MTTCLSPPRATTTLPHWRELAELSDDELESTDIAVMNLACAEGLPGSEAIDVPGCLETLDRWAVSCHVFTNGVIPHFYAGRCDYPESEPKFRVQAMVTHLQRDLGVCYHPDRTTDDSMFLPEDSFVHGVVQGDGGTCGSLPVVYVAVGRRLGFPIRLVTTKGHLFCHWNGAEGFNIEASGEGVSFFSDDYYRTGRFAMPEQTVQACGYLQPLSPREELASFLCQRGECWMQERNYKEAVTAFVWANETDPRRGQHAFLTHQAMRVWHETLKLRLPTSPYFPRLDLGLPAQKFQNLPRGLEREMIGLTVTQGMLDNPDFQQRWWHPMRLDPNRRPPDLPDVMRVNFSWTAHERTGTILPKGG